MRLFLNACLVCTIHLQFTAAALTAPEPHSLNGYRRVSGDGLYKVHAEPRSWNDAQEYCVLEGAALFYPKTLAEGKLAIELLQESFPKGAESWVGAHDLFAPSSFVDLDGKEISSYFAPWSRNEPNYGGRFGSCVMMHPDGSIDDQPCYSWRPFVCKKDSQENLTYNTECDTFDAAYKPIGDSRRCYKIHSEPRTWADAFMTCEAEKAYLTIIDDKEEADFVVNAVKPLFEIVPGNYNKTLISVGFHDRFKKGSFRTINGKKLNTVYNVWAEGQPDDEYGSDDCGAISVTGKLHDMPCDRQQTLFVCERDITHLKNKVE